MTFELKNPNLILNKAFYQVWRIEKCSYRNIARPDHGLLYLFDGNITYSFNNSKIKLEPGDIIYLPKGSNYEVDFKITNGAVKNYLINFDVVNNDVFMDISEPALIFKDSTRVLFDCFKGTVDVYCEKDKPLLTNSLFYQCLNSLITAIQHKNYNEDYLIFEKAAKQLSKDFETNIDEIAKDLHISRSAFQKKFIQYFGVSPIRYRTKKRIEKARLLLDTTDLQIKEISDALGFYDVAYFYKVFKKTYSIAPKKYRDMEKPIL